MVSSEPQTESGLKRNMRDGISNYDKDHHQSNLAERGGTWTDPPGRAAKLHSFMQEEKDSHFLRQNVYYIICASTLVQKVGTKERDRYCLFNQVTQTEKLSVLYQKKCEWVCICRRRACACMV